MREFFSRMIGEEGLKIMEKVPEGEITDEQLAKMSNVKLTVVRKILYTLYENRIVGYRTERDANSGWITYLWNISQDNIQRALEEEVEKVVQNLTIRLEYERNGVFYSCECHRVLFEEAMANDFRCDICGSNYEYVDNEGIIKALQRKIAEIKKWRRAPGKKKKEKEKKSGKK